MKSDKKRRVRKTEDREQRTEDRRGGVLTFCLILCALCSVLCALSASAQPPQLGEPVAPPIGAPAPPPPPQPAPSEPTQPAPGAPAQPTPPEAQPAQPTEELVYLNVQDADIKDVIKQISKATGRNFIIDDKVRGKVTIISERPLTREEAYQTFLSALEVVGFTTVKGPAGVIKIVPLRDAAQQPIPTHVDTTPMTDVFVTRLIPLRNISALDMSSAIKGLISKNGNMFAYPATNTLIITDSGTNIDRLMKIIKELDQEGPQQVMEIIPVYNASARDVASIVTNLFEEEKAKGKVGKRGEELEELAAVSKIIPDERTNSVIVLANRRAIEKVRDIIKRLDAKLELGQEGRIHVYYLKHAKAKAMAETLSVLAAGAGAGAKAAGPGAKAAAPILAEFEGGLKITADEPTNSLVITASAKDYQTLIDKVISKLDIPRRQVYLEAAVMELSVSKTLDFGIGGFGGGSKGPVRIFGADPYPGASGGAGLLSSFLSGAAPTFPTGLLGGLIGRDQVPITIGNETRNIPSVGLFLSALSQHGDANIISTPSILTMDNEEAKIEVKGKEYYKGNPLVSATGTQFSTQASETGLILKITPQIGEADNVSLKIQQSLSDFAGVSNDPQVPRPTKERSIETSVVTRDAQTVVLGGLMEDKMGTDKSKIPILGDIPIIGNLFKKTHVEKRKVNLLVFITPHIVKDPTDFSSILKRKIEERNQFIEANFGRRQRNLIRESIKAHRADLLEYKEELPPPPEEKLKPTASTKAPLTPSAPPPAVEQATQPAAVEKKPVVTVPPPAPGTRVDELELTY